MQVDFLFERVVKSPAFLHIVSRVDWDKQTTDAVCDFCNGRRPLVHIEAGPLRTIAIFLLLESNVCAIKEKKDIKLLRDIDSNLLE